jgi:CheY-specific phosphatase CheX
MAAKFFGQFLLENGLVTGEQLVKAVAIQGTTNVMLGTRAIDAGLMTAADVEKLNVLQRTVDKRFGELAVENGMLSEDQLKALLSTQKQERLFLGEALIKIEALTSEQLGVQLEAFKKEVQGIPGTIAEIYHELPNAAVLEVFTDVTTKMFQRMLHTFVKPTSCHAEIAKVTSCDYTIQQEFTGDFSGKICLNVSAELLKVIAGKLLEMEVTEIDSDTIDGAGEFINVVSGNVCGQLSGSGFKVEIKPPTVHDRKLGAFDFGGGQLTATSLLHPDENIELCIVDSTPQF